MWEESGEYHKAIDRYLEITEHTPLGPEHLEEIWNTCFNLAMNCAKGRLPEVAQVLGPRMLQIKKFESAAEIYEAVGFFEQAIEAYIQC